jgi:hypothetical protein
MPVGILPAIPAASRRTSGLKARRDRLLGWLSTAITALAATLAVLVVAIVAVGLGIT